jgi:hypothetical protein
VLAVKVVLIAAVKVVLIAAVKVAVVLIMLIAAVNHYHICRSRCTIDASTLQFFSRN